MGCFVMFVTAVCVLFLLKLKWPKNKSFYDSVYERYGQETLKTVRGYEKDLSRYNKVSLDIGFLQRCKLFHIFPKFLNFKLSRSEYQDTRACRRFKEELLSFELKKSIDRRKLMESYKFARASLQATLSPLDFAHVCCTIESKASKHKDRISFKLDKKFNNLKMKKFGIPQLSNLSNDDIIFNYSHRVLTEAEKNVLARGLRFCLPPKEVDTYDVKFI